METIPVFDIQGLTFPPSPDYQSNKKQFQKEIKSATPIVIDNGSYNCRVGWGGHQLPAFEFRNIIARQKVTESQNTLVGSEIPESELFKLNIRSPFERNIIQHFNAQENILDYTFWNLGIDSLGNHPILMTEPVCNPNYCKQTLMEILFECYDAPLVNFGIDALFSFRHNVGASSGIIIDVGHTSTHILPVLEGQFLHHHARRLNIGCFLLADAMLNQLRTRYFYGKNNISWPLAQEILLNHCYIATNYIEELENLKMTGQRRIQLPWSLPPPPSEEEILKRQKQKQEQGRRLREIMAKRKEQKELQMNSELAQLEQLMEAKGTPKFNELLQTSGIRSADELNRMIKNLRMKLQLDIEEEKFELLDIPDAELTQEQINKKKIQKAQKAAQDSRNKRRAKEQDEKERIEKIKRDDPDGYLQTLYGKKDEIIQRITDRQQRRQELRDRNSRTSKTRLRQMAELVSDQKDDEHFGMNDEDWQIYGQIANNDQEEDQEDQALLADIELEISQMDPTYIIDSQFNQRQPTAEDYQIHLQADRIRIPEILFQPGIIGIEQAGISEILESVFKAMPLELGEKMSQCVFLTGGGSQFYGFQQRIEYEIRMMRPFQSSFNVAQAKDPSIDAWKGASDFSITQQFNQTGFTKQDYLEGGASYLCSKHDHFASNYHYPTPHKHSSPYKKVRNN